jgi:hypothetical protein
MDKGGFHTRREEKGGGGKCGKKSAFTLLFLATQPVLFPLQPPPHS